MPDSPDSFAFKIDRPWPNPFLSVAVIVERSTPPARDCGSAPGAPDSAPCCCIPRWGSPTRPAGRNGATVPRKKPETKELKPIPMPEGAEQLAQAMFAGAERKLPFRKRLLTKSLKEQR